MAAISIVREKSVLIWEPGMGEGVYLECKFEIVQHEPNIPGKILMQDKPGWRCRTSLHWHSELEFVYMIHGCMEAKVNGQPYVIHDGEFYFCNHEDIHVNAAPDKVGVQKYLVLLLSYDYLKRYCADLDEYVLCVNENEEVRERIATILQQLVAYEQTASPYDSLLKNQMILQLYYVLLTQCLKPRKQVVMRNGNARYAKQVVGYIQEHYKEKVTMEVLAKEVGLSPQYLSKYFKTVTSMNLGQYLGRVRLENANLELLEEDKTVTEVAYENGFANVKSYINTCKQVYGMTPMEYKKRKQVNYK